MTLESHDWKEYAACADWDFADGDPWFPLDANEMTDEAAQICGMCPVRELCVEYAVAEEISCGIFGGLTEVDRKRPQYADVTACRRGHAWPEHLIFSVEGQPRCSACRLATRTKCSNGHTWPEHQGFRSDGQAYCLRCQVERHQRAYGRAA